MKEIEELSLADLTEVFNQGLKLRLDNIGVQNSNIVVKNLVNFATKKQSLITILRT